MCAIRLKCWHHEGFVCTLDCIKLLHGGQYRPILSYKIEVEIYYAIKSLYCGTGSSKDCLIDL